jgi:hypothetical protein
VDEDRHIHSHSMWWSSLHILHLRLLIHFGICGWNMIPQCIQLKSSELWTWHQRKPTDINWPTGWWFYMLYRHYRLYVFVFSPLWDDWWSLLMLVGSMVSCDLASRSLLDLVQCNEHVEETCLSCSFFSRTVSRRTSPWSLASLGAIGFLKQFSQTPGSPVGQRQG